MRVPTQRIGVGRTGSICSYASQPQLPAVAQSAGSFSAGDPFCAVASLNTRVAELRHLASLSVGLACGSTCTIKVKWGSTSCYYYATSGSWWQACTPADHQYWQTIAPSGEGCVQSQSECKWAYVPSCSPHQLGADGEFNYSSWQRVGNGNGPTTRFRVEVRNCGTRSASVYWRARRANSPWSSPQYLAQIHPYHQRNLVLSAGYEGGKWRGWDFFVRADAPGGGLNIASAWVNMTGRPTTCPIWI